MSDEKSDDGIERDLFGAPVDQIRDRWGRPSFSKTKENQQLVGLLRAKGWTQARIAGVLGCDEKTLRKHFSRELEFGADIVEAEAMQVLAARMRQGHVTATRSLLDIAAKGRAAPPLPKDPKPQPLGKKEQKIDRAGRPSDGWGALLNRPRPN